jgi:hypothetical protein
VVAGNEAAVEAFYAAGRQRPVLGTDAFLEWVKTKRPRLSPEYPRYERASIRPSVRQVLKQVAAVFDVKVSTLKMGRRGEGNLARKVAMYLVKRLCDLTLQETAGHFGVESYGVVGWACAQMRAKQATDPRFKKRVAQVEVQISQQTI